MRGGADLVLELPTPYAAATAETFALGGVALLAQTGVVTHLAFGSECGDAAALQRVARALDTPEYHEALRRLLAQGMTFAACRQLAVEQLLGEEDARILEGPNNNLGVEYCRAARRLGSDLQIMTVPRIGAVHDGAPVGEIASASCIRALLRQGKTEEALHFMPQEAAEVLRRELAAGRAPVFMEHCERAVLSHLRRKQEETFACHDGGSEGLYHRFYQALWQCGSIEDLLETAKTKRYTHARLRRMLLAAYLELPVQELPEQLPYLRLLAANERGRALLRQMRENGVPVLTKAADVAALGSEAQVWFTAEAARTDLYTLAYPDLRESVCGSDWRITPTLR